MLGRIKAKNIFKYCFKSYIKLHEYANCNSANYDV